MLNMKEISKLDGKAIEAKVSELRRELFDLRLQRSTTSVEKPHKLKEIRRDIARLLTAKNQVVGK